MLESTIKAIKEKYSDVSLQRESVKKAVKDCMNHYLVEPTVRLEFIDASALFPDVDEVECFRLLFTENAINYSWWGIKVKGANALHGLEKIEASVDDGGTRIENLWLSEYPSTQDKIKLINLIRMGIHHDLF